jgi:hypothetical protein
VRRLQPVLDLLEDRQDEAVVEFDPVGRVAQQARGPMDEV